MAGAAMAQPALAQDRVVEVSDATCRIEVGNGSKALLMRADTDGSAIIGLMFKAAVDTPGRQREGYFYMRLDFSTGGPVTYRDGFAGDYAQGYIADMSVDDLAWMLSETPGRFSYAVGGTAQRIEADTSEDIPEFKAFRTCVEGLKG
ncbi:hypothetical protein [Citromicrobium sp. JL1351]|uniref:hypothetical protein n=2 Tax=Sphingomonadaceae TaxID=41297 RepID=UPI001E4B91A8|nr:hypothetical protein [Citromicrobium sp. JL1351]